jgi:hypothetical protein
VFSFSKRECEALAGQMSSLELTDAAERKLVEGIFWAAMECLGPEDRKLPQVGWGPGVWLEGRGRGRRLGGGRAGCGHCRGKGAGACSCMGSPPLRLLRPRQRLKQHRRGLHA